MRFPRKLAIGLGTFAAALLVVLMLLPLLFRDRIESRLKTEANDAVSAQVAWRGVGLSVLRDFPDVTVSLAGLSVVGVKPFAGDTLVAMREARLVLDVGSVIGYLRSGTPIVVREVVLGAPTVHLRVLADGTPNWDIARQRTAGGPRKSSGVGVTLRDLRIADGAITVDDRQSHLVASVTGLQERLRGDFAQKRFVLSTRTHADSVSVRFAGVPYLSRVAVELNADVNADLVASRFTFANDSLRLNRLVLAFAGSVALAKPNVGIDVSFSTPSTAFGDILSLVPAVYGKNFAQLRTSGSMSTAGRIKGTFGPRAFPALALRARVENGAFRHPALPLPARDIALDLAIDNPGGDLDNTVVDLKRFHAVLGGRPLDARLVLRTPVRDPDVDLRLAGAVDLADIRRTVELEGVTELSGTVAADVAIRARLSDVDAGRYDRVAASGTVDAGRVALRTAAVPRPIRVDTASLRLTPRTAELSTLAGRIGNSDVRAAGSLDNVLGFALRGDDLRGTATVTSTLFDLSEWRSNEKTTDVIPVPPHVDFTLKAAATKVTYGALTMANVRGDLHVKDQRVTLQELSMETLRGKVVANGFYETTVATRPTFDFDLKLAGVDIPAAFAALTTVQKLAPIAKWAQGSVTGSVGLKGPLGRDMTPVLTALTGKGAIETERLLVQGAPVFEKLGSALSLEQLKRPSFGVVKAAYDVADGRLHVKPFVVKVNGIDMAVAGSNGIDQSMSYDLSFAVPGVNGQAVQLGAQLTGTVTDPAVKPSVGGAVGSARDLAKAAVVQAGTTRANAVKEKTDSAAESARARARAEAEKQAATIRGDARALADKTKREGNARADSLMARAANPIAKMAAQAATDRIRREADQHAEQIVREADARADAIVAAAGAAPSRP